MSSASLEECPIWFENCPTWFEKSSVWWENGIYLIHTYNCIILSGNLRDDLVECTAYARSQPWPPGFSMASSCDRWPGIISRPSLATWCFSKLGGREQARARALPPISPLNRLSIPYGHRFARTTGSSSSIGSDMFCHISSLTTFIVHTCACVCVCVVSRRQPDVHRWRRVEPHIYTLPLLFDPFFRLC